MLPRAMRDLLRYYGRWLQSTFRVVRYFFIAGAGGIVISVATSVLLQWDPGLSQSVKDLLITLRWLVPAVILAVLIVAAVFLAPYWLSKQDLAGWEEHDQSGDEQLRDASADVERLHEELRAASAEFERLRETKDGELRVASAEIERLREEYEAAKPHVQVEKTPVVTVAPKRSALGRAMGLLTGRKASFLVAEAWFSNSPRVRSTRARATEVTSRITYRPRQNPDGGFGLNGSWAELTDMNEAGVRGVRDQVDMSPNSVSHHLPVAVKYPDEDVCYAFRYEPARPDHRNESYALPVGETSVVVKLTGVNIEQEFAFTLRNHGQGGGLEFDPARGAVPDARDDAHHP